MFQYVVLVARQRQGVFALFCFVLFFWSVRKEIVCEQINKNTIVKRRGRNPSELGLEVRDRKKSKKAKQHHLGIIHLEKHRY